MSVHRNDVMAKSDEDHETELTRLAESSVEKGVNEITGGVENRDKDFKVKKDHSELNKKKNTARKKKKLERKNRKHRRK
jgi:hypothetical protein